MADPVPRSSHGPWPLIATLLVVATVLGVAAMVAFRIEPLALDHAKVTLCRGCGEMTAPRTATLVYRDGRQIAMGVAVTNTGSVPVSLTEVRLPTAGLLSLASVEVGRRANGPVERGAAGLRPFEPFTLAGGETRWLVLRVTFDRCREVASGKGIRVSSAEFAYRVAGMVPRTSTLDLGMTYELAAPKTCGATTTR